MASKKNKPHDAVKEPETVETTEQTEQTSETPETVTMTQEELETVKKHIDELQKKLDETVALLQRNQADFDNFRKRNASVRADSYDEGKRDCIKALLPVLDDFDRVAESDANADGCVEKYEDIVALARFEGLHVEVERKSRSYYYEEQEYDCGQTSVVQDDPQTYEH